MPESMPERASTAASASAASSRGVRQRGVIAVAAPRSLQERHVEAVCVGAPR
jgi:hypothetical protein